MKKLASLFPVVVIAVGVGACAMESEPAQGENLGQVSQALCKGGLPCRGGGPPVYEVEPEPPPPTFTCPTERPAREPCGPVIRKIDGAYWCVEACPGGPFVIHAANPCGLAYPNYYCTAWGSCYCTK